MNMDAMVKEITEAGIRLPKSDINMYVELEYSNLKLLLIKHCPLTIENFNRLLNDRDVEVRLAVITRSILTPEQFTMLVTSEIDELSAKAVMHTVLTYSQIEEVLDLCSDIISPKTLKALVETHELNNLRISEVLGMSRLIANLDVSDISEEDSYASSLVALLKYQNISLQTLSELFNSEYPSVKAAALGYKVSLIASLNKL